MTEKKRIETATPRPAGFSDSLVARVPGIQVSCDMKTLKSFLLVD